MACCTVQNVAASVTIPSSETKQLDSSSGASWPPLYGGPLLDLDKDLAINYIHKFYCKDCRMEQRHKDEQAGQPTSPQFQLDENPLQLDKNKESLKRKLMLRRSVNELVNQGIMPPLKTPPAFAEKSKQLERAKVGDTLRHKIQSRPDRQALVQQHILEDANSHVDPSLQERQRLLKRARLVDDLNEKLAHRPGPLELVAGNILQTEKDLQRAINDGNIHYNKTCEGEDPIHSSRPKFVFELESPKSDAASSPEPETSEGSTVNSGIPISSPTGLVPVTAMQQAAANQQMFTFAGKTIPITTQSFVPSTSSNSVSVTSPTGTKSSSNGGKSSSGRIKKNKPKTQSKNKVIKFHEYKGPPSSKTQQTTNPPPAPPAQPVQETPYNILLQQQQLFLQWQLEFQQNNMQFMVSPAGATAASLSTIQPSPQPTTQQPITQQIQIKQEVKSPPPCSVSPSSVNSSNISAPNSVTSSTSVASPPPATPVIASALSPKPVVASKSLSKLEDMKVADLRGELKKRNLPVSGTKPQLIERLRPYSDVITSTAPNSLNTNENTVVSLPGLPSINSVVVPMSSAPPSVQPPQFNPEESSMSLHGSPPLSPISQADTNSVAPAPTPLSPVSMDTNVMSPTNSSPHSLIHNTRSQPSIPMAVDQISRPPSVAPMDVEHSSLPANNIPLAPPLPLHLGMVGQPPAAVNVNTSSTQISSEELVKQQQQQIEELQRQLNLSLQQQQLLAVAAQRAAAMQAAKDSSQSIPSIVVTAQPQSHFLQQLQQQQQQQHSGVAVASSSAHELINIGQPKVAFSKLPPSSQPFIFTSKPEAVAKPTVAVMPMNGVVQSKSSSVPSSPVDNSNKANLRRTVTNPFFHVRGKEPPHYEEVVRNRQNLTSDSVPVKSQAMDDLLEVLIRSGEMPASAVHDLPSTPKLSTSGAPCSTITVLSTSGQPGMTNAASPTGQSAVLQLNSVNVHVSPQMLNIVPASPPQDSHKPASPTAVKKEVPPPLNILSITNPMTSADISALASDLSAGFNDLSPFGMDWDESAGTPNIGDLEFGDGLGLNITDSSTHQLLNLPGSSSSVSQSESEPNLANLGISDSYDSSPPNMDVSDWLDVILPNNTGLTPLSTNAPISFSADPLLTPKPQDVLDLFSLDESDFNTPTDVAGGMSWDKLIENSGATTSSER